MKDLSTITEEYLEHLKSINYSERTLSEYSYRCFEFVNFLKEKCLVKTAPELRKAHLHFWQKHLAAQKTNKGLPLKPSTLNRKISNSRELLKFMAENAFIQNTLIKALHFIKEPKFLPMGVVEHRKIRKILAKVPTSTSIGYRDRAVLELLYTTGIRASELVRLNVESVNFDYATILVFGKGRKERVVPMGKTAMRCLETYVKAVRPFLLKNSQEQALFLNKMGTRMLYDTLRVLVHRYFDDTGIEINVTPHTFRRSCTTEMIKGGANLYHIKELLGHEKLDTLKHYIKLTINDLKKTHAKCHPRERDS